MKSNVMVIFGGSGDLAKRKLIPALYMLHKRSLLENDFKIIATGRSILTSDQFRERAEESLSKYINKSDFESGWVESFLPTA